MGDQIGSNEGGGQIGLSASGIFILREKWGGGGGRDPLVSYLQCQASSRPVGHNTDIAIIGLGYRLQLQVQARSVCLASGGPRARSGTSPFYPAVCIQCQWQWMVIRGRCRLFQIRLEYQPHVRHYVRYGLPKPREGRAYY